MKTFTEDPSQPDEPALDEGERIADGVERIGNILEKSGKMPTTGLGAVIRESLTRAIDPPHLIAPRANVVDGLFMIAQSVQDLAKGMNRLANAAERMVPARPTTSGPPLI